MPSTPSATPSPSSGPPVRVLVVGRPGCHLCDVAEDVVAQVTADLGVGWEKRSIDDDPVLHDRYWEQIPVVLVDGVQHDFYTVSPQRLRAALGG
jgi:hypothetical protein